MGEWRCIAVLAGLPFLACQTEELAVRLHPTGAYFYRPGAEPSADATAFERALTAECARRSMLRSAPLLARSAVASKMAEEDRSDPDGALRIRYLNEALRRLRVDALVRADREVTEAEVRALFERQHGPGGRLDRVRMVSVTLAAERRRREAGNLPADRGAVLRAAEERCAALLERARVAGFAAAEAGSDRPTAGVLDARELQRYGRVLQRAVAELAPGGLSGVLRSRVGFHIVELVERRVTRIEEVAPQLRSDLRSGSATELEERDLKRRLLGRIRDTQEERT